MKGHPFLILFISIAMIVGGFMILPTAGLIDTRSEAEKAEHRKQAMTQLIKRFPASKSENYAIKDATVRNNKIVIRNLSYTSSKPQLSLTVKRIELPTSSIGINNTNKEETRFRDIVIRLKDLPPLAGFYLKQLGFDQLRIQAHTRHAYNPAARTYRARIHYELEDAAIIEADITLGNVTPEFARGIYSDLNVSMKNLSLVSFKLTLHNKGILKKILRMVPGGNEQFILTVMDRDIAKARNENRKKTLRAMKVFIVKKGSISVSTRPEKPFPLRLITIRDGLYDSRLPLDIRVH